MSGKKNKDSSHQLNREKNECHANKIDQKHDTMKSDTFESLIAELDPHQDVKFESGDAKSNDTLIDSINKLKRCPKNRMLLESDIKRLHEKKCKLVYTVRKNTVTGLSSPVLNADGELTFYLNINTDQCYKDVYSYVSPNDKDFHIYALIHPIVVVLGHEDGHLDDALDHLDEILAGIDRDNVDKNRLDEYNRKIGENYIEYNKKRFNEKFREFSDEILTEIKGWFPYLRVPDDITSDTEKFIDFLKKLILNDLLQFLDPKDKASVSCMNDRNAIEKLLAQMNFAKKEKIKKIYNIYLAYAKIHDAWNSKNYDDLLIILPKLISFETGKVENISDGALLKEYFINFGDVPIFILEELTSGNYYQLPSPDTINPTDQKLRTEALFGGTEDPVRYSHQSFLMTASQFDENHNSTDELEAKIALKKYAFLFISLNIKIT